MLNTSKLWLYLTVDQEEMWGKLRLFKPGGDHAVEYSNYH